MLCGWLQCQLAYSCSIMTQHQLTAALPLSKLLAGSWHAAPVPWDLPPHPLSHPPPSSVLHSPVDGINRGICHSLGDHKKARGRQKLVNYCWHHAWLCTAYCYLTHFVGVSDLPLLACFFLTHSCFHSLYPSLIFHSVQLFSPVSGPSRRNTSWQ